MMQNEHQVEEIKFLSALVDFWDTRGRPGIQTPSIGDVEIPFWKLYNRVCHRGGYRAVSNNRRWKNVVEELGMSEVNNAASLLKRIYYRYLYPFEQNKYYGRQNHRETPDLIPARLYKCIKIDDSSKSPSKLSNGLHEDLSGVNLYDEICKHYETQQKMRGAYFLHKEKLEPTVAELKRITLGLESKMKNEVILALNMLLLYSAQQLTQQMFDELSAIVEALYGYANTIYPPKNSVHLQHLRVITLILRNFSVNQSYLQVILKSPLFQILVQMYNNGLDRECSRNVVDTLAGLLKVGWDPQQIVKQIEFGLENESPEDVQMGVDLIRGLVDERVENIDIVVINSLETFVKVFITASSETRETVLDIFAHISDLNASSRLVFARHPLLIHKLVDIMAQGQYDKLCNLAAVTLSYIAAAPGTREYIKDYERELAIIASSNERIGNIAAVILSEINSV